MKSWDNFFFRGLITLAVLTVGFPSAHGEREAGDASVKEDHRAMETPRTLVHLLDYMGQDYAGAVADGKVIDPGEYEEMREFSGTVLELSSRSRVLLDQPDLIKRLEALRDLIEDRESPDRIAETAREARERIIQATGLEISPTGWPDLSKGRPLFRDYCASCHGSTGSGDGPAAASLDPRPANLRDDTRMRSLSPFQIFNTIRLGISGTGMGAFPQLTEKEAWELAFFTASLRYRKDASMAAKEFQGSLARELDGITLQTAASRSDADLESFLSGDGKRKKALLAALRLKSGPEAGGPLEIARTNLAMAMESFRKGNLEEAKKEALTAYLQGVEPIEPRLKAMDPAFLGEMEEAMYAVRTAIGSDASESAVSSAIQSARQSIDDAEKLLVGKSFSVWLVFSLAAAIILREGFEALLIIVAILGVVKAVGSARAARWVHAGWVSALFAGFLTWFLSQHLITISGIHRELMEGITSLFAVIVLLYLGFWMHRKTEIGRWTAFIDGQVKDAVEEGNLWGLVTISFLAVFREAFETILFLSALGLEAGAQSQHALFGGFLSALLLILVLGWALLSYSARIPMRTLFSLSSGLMAFLSIALVGQALHAFQETGIISTTLSPLSLRLDLAGFYPTFETQIAQILILGIAGILWLYGRKPSPDMV